MQENVSLIKEINELRREIKGLKQGVRPAAGQPIANGKETPVGSSGRGSRAATASVEAAREIEIQREEIMRLRHKLELMEGGIANRPTSREKLPPMDGFTEGMDPPGSATPTAMA